MTVRRQKEEDDPRHFDSYDTRYALQSLKSAQFQHPKETRELTHK